MGSAYNLPFDILRLIFAHLSGNDLVSVSLVSSEFLNGVTPRLYHSLVFSHIQTKKYPKMISPFASLLAQPSLGIYVRVCDISALPLYKGQPNQDFLCECIRALDLCPNLTRFRLAPNVLPSFLPTLTRKEKLRELQVNGSLTMDQSEVLISVKGLKNVRLDHASWCLMNLFPRWLSVIGSTLTHLSFTLSSDLNELILEELLIHLPGLRGLHIRNCMKIDHHMVFKLIEHTPLLESLVVNTWENATNTTASFAGVSNLKHLHLDTRNSNIFSPSAAQSLWSGIIAHTVVSHAQLKSLTLQLSEKLEFSSSIIDEILDAHAQTLTSLRFIRCSVPIPSLKAVCQRCTNLEKLALNVLVKDLIPFANALSKSTSLQMLVDEPDPHTSRGPRASLKHEDVKMLMTMSPRLRNIVSDSRSWKGYGYLDNLQITLERTKHSPHMPSVMNFS